MECPSQAVIDSHGDSQGYSGDCKTLDSSLCLMLHLPAYIRVPSISIQPVKAWEEYRMEAETCIQPPLSLLSYLFLILSLSIISLLAIVCEGRGECRQYYTQPCVQPSNRDHPSYPTSPSPHSPSSPSLSSPPSSPP